MKKIVITITLLSALLLTACGNNEETVQADATVSSVSEQQAEVSAAAITDAIMAEIEIPSAMEKTIDKIGAYYDIDVSTVAEMSVFICGSGAYPDELAVFKFNDKQSAEAGAELVQKRLESQIELYTDYTPAEIYKLNEAVLMLKDNWVVFAACSDNERAKEIIENLL